mmetsp:Transcript_54953/g.125091  ORF Transcript_54953/g.125091 Transcript_54953/m.125091 type:complete len:241 (-) Transcript_54953:168-890(-)
MKAQLPFVLFCWRLSASSRWPIISRNLRRFAHKLSVSMVSLGVRISVCFTVFTPLRKEIIQPKRRRYEVKIRKNKSTVNTQDARSTWPRSGQVISVIMSIIIVVDSATRFTAPVLNFSSEDLANAGELKLQRSATYNWECSAESLQATAGEMALIATGVPQHKEENEGSSVGACIVVVAAAAVDAPDVLLLVREIALGCNFKHGKMVVLRIASPPNHALRPNISASKVPFILRYHHSNTI